MSDLVVNVRQVTSYPATTPVPPTAALLLQNGGLGSPYISATAQALVATALSSGTIPLGIGITPPANAAGGQTFTEDVVFQAGGAVLNNAYFNSAGQLSYLASGPASAFEWSPNLGFAMTLAPAGSAGQPVSGLTTMLSLGLAGNMVLPFGTLTVARDPASAMEVATMRWVGNNTVASFNGRIGAVQLWSSDIYAALCLDSAIASQNWVNQAIGAAIQNMLMTCPFVNRWNGRTGSVYLTLSDITCVFFQPGQQPISPTPPLTSNDNSIATTQWVQEYVANEFAGGGGNLATQAWVLANTVNSFNGRQGVVNLTLADITNVGGAAINSPAFSGIPTAPTANPGQATGQIATTAFVQTAIASSVAGVASFNTRTGAVTLESADIVAAGGLANPSPNLTGNPTAPTQAPGTNLPVIATCQFVTSAINAAVTSFNTRTGAVTLLLSDVTGVGGAPIANPTFTGVPNAPTASAGTSTTQLATTAFVSAAVAAAGGVSSFNSRTGAVDLEANDISAAGGLVNPSVGLTGVPTAPTATTGTNTSQIATTAFVVQALSAGAVSSFNTRTGAVVLSSTDITGAGGALIASPTFTGTPAAPTAAPGTNNTQLATTAFVTAAIAADTAGVTSFNTRTGAVVLTTADITGAGGAPTASPSFSGNPTAPTATLGTSTTQIATTAFVAAAIAGSGVNSFNGRTGAVTLIANDISAASGALIASPTFTGTPAAPTAAPGTSTTQLATTAFVAAAIGAYLPLTGGTLSGNLNITNALASMLVTSTGAGNAAQIGATATASGQAIISVTAARNWSIGSFSNGNFGIVDNTASQTRMTITPAGNSSFAGPFAATVITGTQLMLSSPANVGTYTVAGPPLQVINAFSNNAWWAFDTTTANITWFINSTGAAFEFFTNGNLQITGTYLTGSDATNKTNMVPLTQGISLIRKLIPKSFAFILTPDQTQWGFVAQDVQPVIPEAVNANTNPSGKTTLGLDPTALLAAAVYAIQQLDQRCQALEAAASITPPASALA